MKKIFALLYASVLLFAAPTLAQTCIPDPACSQAQLICPPQLPQGCSGDPYSETVTISLGSTIGGFSFTSITLTGITGMPPGFNYSCNPSDCIFYPNTLNCIQIFGTTNSPGTYSVRAQMTVNIGFIVNVDTAIGTIIIVPKDCAGTCGGSATVDNCGICSGGSTGIPPNCNDGDPCTSDACDGLGGCLNTPACDDGDSCTEDVCNAGLCAHTPVDCDDFDECTIDECIGGNCVYTPVDCDDNDACNGDESCDSATGCQAGIPLICDVVDICTEADCNPISGCVYMPVNCDDADECTTDNCDASNGCFNEAVVCNDADACTNDTCFIQSGCAFFPINCDDGDACNGIETCDSLSGCLSGTPVDCDDGDTCTFDICDMGLCFYTLNPACADPCHGVSCDDSDECTIDECNLGNCFNTPVDCDDGDACTEDYCDPSSGCFYLAILCDDQDVCTADGCDSINGCEFILIEFCDDFDECTLGECDPVIGCFYMIIDCDDFDECTIDACDTLAGCNYAAVDCDDGDACTDDACDMQDGCLHDPVDCDDGDDCNGIEICDNVLGCLPGMPIICDDGDSCTIDVCIMGLCEHTPDPNCIDVCFGLICDDADECTTDTCIAGQCIYTVIDCDDGDSCTFDFCDALLGCYHQVDPSCVTSVAEFGGRTHIHAYPNPFSDKLIIEFSVPASGFVTLDILDISGKRLASIFNGIAESGANYRMEFIADGMEGGMIFYRLANESDIYYGKAVLVK